MQKKSFLIGVILSLGTACASAADSSSRIGEAAPQQPPKLVTIHYLSELTEEVNNPAYQPLPKGTQVEVETLKVCKYRVPILGTFIFPGQYKYVVEKDYGAAGSKHEVIVSGNAEKFCGRVYLDHLYLFTHYKDGRHIETNGLPSIALVATNTCEKYLGERERMKGSFFIRLMPMLGAASVLGAMVVMDCYWPK